MPVHSTDWHQPEPEASWQEAGSGALPAASCRPHLRWAPQLTACQGAPGWCAEELWWWWAHASYRCCLQAKARQGSGCTAPGLHDLLASPTLPQSTQTASGSTAVKCSCSGLGFAFEGAGRRPAEWVWLQHGGHEGAALLHACRLQRLLQPRHAPGFAILQGLYAT